MWKWPALFLDDICAERDTTGFTSEQLNTLLGCRENKWTVITSNKLLHQIAELEPRLADRIIRAPNIFIEVNTKSHALRHVEA
jgi:DNA replication protein DnaC